MRQVVRLFNFPLLFQLLAVLGTFALAGAFPENRLTQPANFAPQIFVSFGPNPIETKSQFVTKISQKKEVVPFKTISEKDQNLNWGQVVVGQKGKNGEDIIVTETLFWKSNQVGTRTYTKQILPPQPQINLIGSKLIPGEIITPFGKLTYRGKTRVFATSYDKNCRGCNETTATGAKLAFGIAAVDSAFIPLGSKIYVEGYGQAIAADTGGAIKGTKIDLAFDDVKNGFWRSRWTEVYLLE